MAKSCARLLTCPPFRQVHLGSEAHVLPALLGKKPGQPVYRFERGVPDAKVRSKIEAESLRPGVSKYDIVADSLAKSDQSGAVLAEPQQPR